jgi:hypothetical protein
MIAAKYNPDPSDLSQRTIQKLFYRQVRNLSVDSCSKSVEGRMSLFDLQFSDAWF